MLKLPLWVLEQLVKAGKVINPSDVFQQSNVDDLVHIASKLMGH